MNILRTVTIPAVLNNVDGVYTESAVGMRFFICLSASAAFRVQFDQDQPFDVTIGVSRDAGNKGMRHLLLTNTTAIPIVATFVLSDAPHLSPPNVLTSTTLQSDAQSQVNLATNGNFVYLGTRVINGQSRQRKYLELDFTGGTELEVRETATGRMIARLQQNTFRRFDLADNLTIHNSTGGGVQVTVYEVF